MGIFDKVLKDAEEAMAQDDPGLTQPAGQFGGGRAGRDRQAARHLTGRQRGAQDQDQDRDDQAEDHAGQALDGNDPG
jgi:hypothetical protein